MNSHSIIKPVITEKSMREAQNGKFTFQVSQNADKREVRKAIEDAFNVHVVSIQTVITKGKSKRVGKRMQVLRLSPVKKAIARVRKGEKIALFDVGEKK